MGGTVVGVIRCQVGNGQGEAVPDVDQLVPGVEVGPPGILATIGVQGHVGPFHLSHAGQEFGHLLNLGVDVNNSLVLIFGSDLSVNIN